MSCLALKHAFVALAGAGLLLAANTATASPPHKRHHDDGYARYAGPHHLRPYGPTCRTVYTFGRRGTRKIVVCDGPARHVGPPPWAPAHGYRKKHHAWRPYRHDRRRVHWQHQAPWRMSAPTPSTAGDGCQSTVLTGVIGGVSGALLGNQIGNGSGRAAATAAGALIGTLAGLSTGRSLDRACLRQTLEHVPDGGTVTWNDQRQSGRPWQATPTATWQAEDGRYCREFTGVAAVAGQPQQIYGRACRQPDGSWEIVPR